jgi:hypothetical protein
MASNTSPPTESLSDSHTESASDAPDPGPAPGLYAPSLWQQPPSYTLQQIVSRIMSPAGVNITLGQRTFVVMNITTIVGIAGPEHFEGSAQGRRHTLVSDDELAVQGRGLGLSQEVLNWLLYSQNPVLILPLEHFLLANGMLFCLNRLRDMT